MNRRRRNTSRTSPSPDVQTLLSLLAYQDSLLQTYRSVHFTFQSIVVAIAGAITGNALQSPPTIQFVFFWLVILAMFAASLYFGRLTQGLIESTGKDVSCLQSMLKATEMSEFENDSRARPHYTIWQELRNPMRAFTDQQTLNSQLHAHYEFYSNDGFTDRRVTNGFFRPDHSTGGWGQRGAREKWRQLMTVWTNWIWFILIFTLSLKTINEAITVSEQMAGSEVRTHALIEYLPMIFTNDSWTAYFPSPDLLFSLNGVHAFILIATLVLPILGLAILILVGFIFYTQFATLVWQGRSPNRLFDFSIWRHTVFELWESQSSFWRSFPVSLVIFLLALFITLFSHPFRTLVRYFSNGKANA